MNDAVVMTGFMASLNVNTTDAVGETPLAMLEGTAEMRVGCACDRPTLASKTANVRSATR